MHSQRKFCKAPCLYDGINNKLITASSYSGVPRPSRNYESIKQADVERASKLSDYQLLTTDQNAHKQWNVLANEIAFEEFSTEALIKMHKVKIAAEMNIESS